MVKALTQLTISDLPASHLPPVHLQKAGRQLVRSAAAHHGRGAASAAAEGGQQHHGSSEVGGATVPGLSHVVQRWERSTAGCRVMVG